MNHVQSVHERIDAIFLFLAFSVRNKGRNPKKYKITARSTDRDEIEAFLQEVNTAPDGSTWVKSLVVAP